jgi:hypothetical protein
LLGLDVGFSSDRMLIGFQGLDVNGFLLDRIWLVFRVWMLMVFCWIGFGFVRQDIGFV